MNTVQNYTGVEDSTNSTPQKATISAETSSTVDSRQPATNLEREYQDLYRLVGNFLNEAGTSGPVELVNGLVLDAVHNSVGFDPESEYEPTKQYPISQADLARMFSANQLTSFLFRLSDKWQHISRLRNEAIKD